MCTSYGVDPERLPEMRGMAPEDERLPDSTLNEWMRSMGGHARITGRNARNFNPIIRPDGDGRRLDLAWWGLWRNASGPAKFSFNARDDRLTGVWKGPFQRRALIPATWYDEGKRRWRLPDGSPFLIAALTSTVQTPDGEVLSYAMVTRAGLGEASSVISSRGDSRMPLVLPPELHEDWLDPERPGDTDLADEVRLGSDEISRALTAGGDTASPETLF